MLAEEIDAHTNTYLITYDLRDPGANYLAVEDAIKKAGKAVRVLESVWVVQSNRTAAGLLDHVAGTVRRKDGFLVVRVSAPWDRSEKLYSDTDYDLLEKLLGSHEL